MEDIQRSKAVPFYYVGSQISGNMANNVNEGHWGAVIGEIANPAEFEAETQRRLRDGWHERHEQAS